MQVSFIVSLFNQLPLTQACYRSLRQTLPAGLAHEVILIDDASTDGTREWLQTLRLPAATATRVLLNECNVGYAASNNRAAREARGDIFFLLNSDLELLPGWFEPMLRAFRHLSGIGLVGNLQYRVADHRLDHRGVQFDPLSQPLHDRRRFTWASLKSYTPYRAVTAACCAIRRTTFQQAGGFDEAYRNGYEDIDLCLRLGAQGFRHYVANHSAVLHHVSASPGRFTHESDNLRLFRGRWRPPPPSSRFIGLRYLARYWIRPWRYNGPKLLLALARIATNRPCDFLIVRWKIQGATM
ncbi:MAG TPA: glycosyltransferase family 2 protein [Opitutus sp.]|nr:glycosyltransferase family 2 protein [Opitutus sp.]